MDAPSRHHRQGQALADLTGATVSGQKYWTHWGILYPVLPEINPWVTVKPK
jgi:hypothetical protein